MRTQLSSVQQKENGKWSVSFETLNGIPGQEYVANTVESAAVFTIEDDAHAGGARAMYHLAETGMYPNMCEPF